MFKERSHEQAMGVVEIGSYRSGPDVNCRIVRMLKDAHLERHRFLSRLYAGSFCRNNTSSSECVAQLRACRSALFLIRPRLSKKSPGRVARGSSSSFPRTTTNTPPSTAHYDYTTYLYAIMMTTSLSDSDPFASNSNLSPSEEDYVEGATLPVGRDASLTLATDSLIVLGIETTALANRNLLTFL